MIEPVSAAKVHKPENIKNDLGKDKSEEDEEFIMEILKQHYLLFSMTSKDIGMIVKEMSLCAYKKGQTFIKQGN